MTKQSSPVTRRHSTTSGVRSARSATLRSWPGAGRTRMIALSDRPSERGSTSAWYPRSVPCCSSRASRRRFVSSGDDSSAEPRWDLWFTAIPRRIPAIGHSRKWPRKASSVAVRPPPHVYFVVSAVFHHLGPAFAVLLFARVDVLGVAWLRIVSAALVFVVWRRPWAALRRPLVLGWGAVLAVMNCCFYEAISRLPLGTVAAIEFLPVIALAALGARTPRNALALALAVPGVYVLTRVQIGGEPLGLVFA